MINLDDERDKFLDQVLHDNTGQEQINDMAMAFDVGAISAYKIMLEAVHSEEPDANVAILTDDLNSAIMVHLDRGRKNGNIKL